MDEDLDESTGESGGGWMATFADMMTLLLCFFVLLLSFATMDVQKFQDALGSVQEALGVHVLADGPFQARSTSPDEADLFEAVPEPMDWADRDQALLKELEAALQAEGLEGEVAAAITGRGVLLRITGRVMYDVGNARLQARAFSLLDRLATIMGGLEHAIMIEGHTDDIPIATSLFPSNWELSTARAIAAMRYLVGSGVDAARIAVAGYADQRPLRPNETADNRAANRRVEFVFRRDSWEAVPPVEVEALDAADGGVGGGGDVADQDIAQ